MLVLNLVSFSLYVTFMAWAPAAAVLYVCRKMKYIEPDRAHFYWRVLKWPSLAGIVSLWAINLLTTLDLTSPDLVFFGLFLTYWLCLRNVGRDTEEKKDPRRVRARLKQVGGRLVVVSETTSA